MYDMPACRGSGKALLRKQTRLQTTDPEANKMLIARVYGLLQRYCVTVFKIVIKMLTQFRMINLNLLVKKDTS